MAVAQVEDIPYSLDSAFEDLIDKDRTVEISGYICSVVAAKTVGNGFRLMKFALTNGNMKVTCLLWGQALIDLHQASIIINRKVHIDGAHCKVSKLTHAMENDNYCPFELNIQPSTVMTFGNMHESEEAAAIEPEAQEVTFETINRAQGLIAIDGFIKMRFTTIPSRFENASYGCGSITDGIFKVTVNISNFVPDEDLRKGHAVRIIGNVNTENNAPLVISCRDMNGILRRENVPAMSERDLALGTRAVKRVSAP